MDQDVRDALNAIVSGFEQFKADTDRHISRASAPRVGGGSGSGREFGDLPKAAEQKAAFLNYARTGVIETKALVVGDDIAAGYLAPEGYSTEMERNLVQFSPVRQAARVGAMSNHEIRLPKRTHQSTAYWTGETEDRTESQPSYGLDTIVANEMATFIDVSNQMLEDSAIDLAAELTADLGEAFGQLEGTAFLLGNGPNRPQGILTVGVATVNSGAATTVTADSLRTTLFNLPQFYRSRSTWMMNPTTAGWVSKLKDGDGNYLWTPGLLAGQEDLLLGRPILEAIDMPDMGAGLTPVLFGDFSKYRIFDRIGLSVLRDPFSIAANGQVRFHARRRVGGGVRLAEAFRTITCSV